MKCKCKNACLTLGCYSLPPLNKSHPEIWYETLFKEREAMSPTPQAVIAKGYPDWIVR
jgi:hypothetical protein